MEFIKNIEKLCSQIGGSIFPMQITIDFFEEFEEQFLNSERNLNEKPIERDELMAKQYDISILLEVMDHAKFSVDVELFQKLDKEIGIWAKAVEDRNKLLGIDWHKG